MAFLGLEVWHLPALNAFCNAASAIFLLLAFFFIRRGHVRWHWTSILLALTSSTLFLTSYLVYHYKVGHVPYGGMGWMRWIYFGILISHTLLAVVLLPMIPTTIGMAVRHHPRHPTIGRVTLATWLYVSVTGVLVFWMLRPYALAHFEQLRVANGTPAQVALILPKTEVRQNARQ
jgi:uncharacterized membrane protein YozB (DUF420 family)